MQKKFKKQKRIQNCSILSKNKLRIQNIIKPQCLLILELLDWEFSKLYLLCLKKQKKRLEIEYESTSDQAYCKKKKKNRT